MPKTRFFGQPVASRAIPVVSSTGLATAMRGASGGHSPAFPDTGLTTAMLFLGRYICETGRCCGGVRGSPP